MENQFFNQFEMARSWTLEVAERVEQDKAEIVPEGFRNNILWQIGHVLLAAENFLFSLRTGEHHLPEHYSALFGTGTKPADWQGEIPSKEELVDQLRKQLERVREIDADQLEGKLKEPMFGFTTIVECTNFIVLHEALHVGKMEEMERVVKR